MRQRKVFIVGGYLSPFIGKGSPLFIDKKHADFGKKQNRTLEQFTTEAINGAFKNTNVDPALVDRIAIGNFCGELFSSQGHLGAAAVGANPKLRNKPAMRVEGACASGALALQVALDSIRAGTADVALAVGSEVQTTVAPRVGGDYLARASHYARQRSIDDFTFPALFARRMKHIQAAGHFTMEDTARVSAKAYANGNKNPLAHMNTATVTFEQANTISDKNPNFLGNAEFKDFLRITDCSQVTDGSAAVIVASEEGLKKIGGNPQVTEILALECATGDLYSDSADFTKMEVSGAAAARAFEKAGITPKDLQVAEVHDCFTIAELLMYEALGIAPYGGAKDLIRSGATNLDGRIPVNTGGGLISFGHPVGATGIKQILEIYRQMKGQCGDYQLKTRPVYGACLNMGGDDKTAVCTIIKNL